MSVQLKLRRGTAALIAAFTGAQGELTVTTDTTRLIPHDGVKAGGYPHALQNELVLNLADTSTTANLITVASTIGPAAPVDGMLMMIKVKTLGTGGTTNINYNATGNKPLVVGSSATLVAGALQAGSRIICSYDATAAGYKLLANAWGNPQFANPLPISQGGTGASTVAGVLAALGLTEALVFAGTWNASTNTPTLTSGSGTAGQLFRVQTAGTTTLDGISSWNVGDYAAFSGVTNTWQKFDGVASEVLSVAGRVGDIILTSADLTDFNAAAAAAAPVQSVAGYTGTVTLAVDDISGAAPIASPAFAGGPTAPTQSAADNSTKLATTAYVDSAVAVETARAEAAEADLIPLSQKGAANGVLALDATGKAPFSQLPDSLSQATYYAGTWDASTNTPTLTSGAGASGAEYKVSVAGTTTLDGISTWNVGDKAVFNGVTSTWEKIDGIATEVLSVNGQVGAVSLNAADIPNAADLAAQNTFQKTASATIQPVSYASTLTLDLTQGNDAAVTLTGNVTFANPTIAVGSSGHIKITQDSTGGRTATWGSYWKFGAAGTPTLSTSANAIDVLAYWVMDSTHVVACLINGVQ